MNYTLQNRILDSVGEGEGGMFQENSIETCILSRVKQITSPGWMHETSAPAWCTGKTQRNRGAREVGGGSGMRNTCKSSHVWINTLIHVNIWQKPLQYCKVISLQLIKINGKKNKSTILQKKKISLDNRSAICGTHSASGCEFLISDLDCQSSWKEGLCPMDHLCPERATAEVQKCVC